MDNEIIISVIIPHYNSNFLIERALNSIGVHSDIEIIVVDDFSTEDSIKKVAKKPEFEHVIFIFPGKKVTSGGARNIGIEKARGKYLLFVDSDDYLHENVLDLFRQKMQTNKDFYQFRADSFLEETGEIGTGTRIKHFKKYYEMENREGLLGIGTPWAKLIKREFVLNNGIRFSAVPPNHGDDIYFSMQVAVFCRTFEFCKEVVYLVSQGTVNTTSNRDAECYIGLLKEVIKCNHLIKKSGVVNNFHYFKNISNHRWIDIAIQVGSSEYNDLLVEFKKSLPLSVRTYWWGLGLIGRLQSPQLHFSSSRNVDICYVFQKGINDKLIVNFNDFGSFDKDAAEGVRFPYFFVNTYRKTKYNVLDLRDFWGTYGVYYVMHKGERIDQDIHECIQYVMTLLSIKKENVLLFGTGKGATAAIHYAHSFGFKHCVAIAPHNGLEPLADPDNPYEKTLQNDIFGNDSSNEIPSVFSLLNKKFETQTDDIIVYTHGPQLYGHVVYRDLSKTTSKKIIASEVLSF